MRKPGSWVIIEKATGEAVFETFNESITKTINIERYRVIPILEYLQSLNARIKKVN